MECEDPEPRAPDKVPPDPPYPNTGTSGVSGANLKRRCVEEPQTPAKKNISNPDLTVPSIQTVYTHPSFVIGAINTYSENDKGPYIVHVSRISPDPAAGTSIRPIKFGQFLSNHKFQNIHREGVKRVGRNKISVQFTSAEDANNFITSPVLALCKYTASIPTFSVTRMGLVRQVPTDLSMEEFATNALLPPGCGNIIKARRLSRKNVEDGKVSWVPTQSVVVTFLGQSLPSKIFLYYTSLPVELYNFPTTQCYACCRYGHTKAACRSKPRCFRCSKEHLGDSCEVTESGASCAHCLGRHFATNRSCPEQERQRSIKVVMAQQSISYVEACAQFPTVSRPYSEIAQPNHSSVRTIYTTPRPRAPLGKSYDKVAHRDLVSTPVSSMPNGCAIIEPGT
ncbi:hypothetical protein Cfor_12613, partial [Coptotermes formosanus]